MYVSNENSAWFTSMYMMTHEALIPNDKASLYTGIGILFINSRSLFYEGYLQKRKLLTYFCC